MTETNHTEPHGHDKDKGAVVRSILQGLILAGIVGLVTMVLQQGEKASRADAERAVQIATLQAQVTNVQRSLADMPDLSARVMRLETNQAELMRRQAVDEARWERLGEHAGRPVKGWER